MYIVTRLKFFGIIKIPKCMTQLSQNNGSEFKNLSKNEADLKLNDF